jgi:flagellar biosynthesis protein FlhF
MRLKSFYGPNLTEAMRQVREALGENAIIVATRDDDMGGIRVTAAIDDAPPPNSLPSPVFEEADDRGSEAIEVIAEALARHQVSSHIAERLLATATQFANDDPVLALGAAFDTHFKFQPIIDDKPDRQFIVVGPPGAGKTLSIAKFATKATLSKRKVTVVSTDVDRAGGMEQLAAFTRLLKLNLIEIEDAHALRDAVMLQKDSLIFIDTAGRNPFRETERQQLQSMVQAVGGEATLVLPAGMDGNEAVDMANEFRKTGASRLLFTRLDMTRRLGSMLRVAFDAHLPFANFSMSNNVTEAPQPMNPILLARLVLNKPEAAQESKTTRKQSTT